MERKTFRGRMEFVSKADGGQEGAFRAEFATLNVVDHDGDVTEAGAFEEGQPTLIEAWNHNYGELPVGKGVIHEKDDKAIIEGQFFLDTEGGLEHYKTIKNLDALAQWSYTFDIVDSGTGKFEEQDVRFLRKLDVWGVAPVERGAGIETRTVDIKTGGKQGVDLQELHDMLVSLGAKCSGHNGDPSGEEPSQDQTGNGVSRSKADPSQGQTGNSEPRSEGDEVLAARVALELVETGCWLDRSGE